MKTKKIGILFSLAFLMYSITPSNAAIYQVKCAGTEGVCFSVAGMDVPGVIKSITRVEGIQPIKKLASDLGALPVNGLGTDDVVFYPDEGHLEDKVPLEVEGDLFYNKATQKGVISTKDEIPSEYVTSFK